MLKTCVIVTLFKPQILHYLEQKCLNTTTKQGLETKWWGKGSPKLQKF